MKAGRQLEERITRYCTFGTLHLESLFLVFRARAPILVFRYLLKELIPQFLSALVVICAIIVVSQLVRLSEVLVTFGLSLENVFLPFLYILLPFVQLTIPMAYLFAVMLTFGRLSADGEYPGLLAAGYSLSRAAVPTLLIGVLLYAFAAVCALNLEAWGRREMVQFLYRKTQTELDNMIKYKLQSGVFVDDFLGYVLYVEKISTDRTKFENVLLAPAGEKDESQRAGFTVLAPSGSISGTVETGDLRMTLDNGTAFSHSPEGEQTSVLKFNHAEIDLLRIFQEQILGADAASDDYRSYTFTELLSFIKALEANPQRDVVVLRRARYLLHKRIAAPFATVTFAFFGMTLGVSDPRRGRSIAYIGVIATVIIGFVIMTAFDWLVEHGHIPLLVAAWAPNLILLAFGAFLLFQKNRLPPAEGTLDLANLPLLGRHGYLRRLLRKPRAA